jgi:DNA helicase II / ATP-dependent DNA helicase PcrA
MASYDLTAPWNLGVKGTQALPLINDDAPVIRIEAGPGTGKTFGLVRRVVRILHPDGLGISGRKVAVVAFNRVIAKQLREEITEALKNFPHDQAPVIQTVHGFCLHIIGQDVRILLPHEREAMLYDVLHEYPVFRKAFKNRANAEQALHDHEAHLHNYPVLWQAADRWLIRHKARLISDLPGLLSDRIKGGDFGDCQYDHVIVDEFQDLTPAEQELFLKLRSSEGQLVALGDPRQSIYAFLGNDRQGLAKIGQHQALAGIPIRDVPMTDCQRCPKELVIAANKLMSLSEAMPMTPVNDTPAKILVVHWKTSEAEAKGMAQLIRDNINACPQEHKHLVMVTRRQYGYRLRDELSKIDSSISVDLGFSESILELWAVREAFLFFCLLADPDPPTWRAWLGYRLPSSDTNHLAPKRNAPAYLGFFARCNDTISSERVLRLCEEARATSRGEGGSALWDRACRYRDLLKQAPWTEIDAPALIERVFDSEHWIVGNGDKDITAIKDLSILRDNALVILNELDPSQESVAPEERLRKVASQLRYSIATRESLSANSEAKLKVATLWGAKGLTADHVYVIGLCDEAIPGVRTEEYPGTDLDYREEQRRLFYVSITRSKQTLVLSRPQKIRPGDAKRLNLRVKGSQSHYLVLQMCPFLRDIMSVLPGAVLGESLLQANPPFSLSQL